jgi:hypothetical protein
MNINDALKLNLIKELGIDRLPQADQEAALLKIGDIIFQAVLIRVLDELKDEDRKELDVFLENPAHQNDPESFYSFLADRLSNLDEIVAEEVANFKRDTFEVMSNIK